MLRQVCPDRFSKYEFRKSYEQKYKFVRFAEFMYYFIDTLKFVFLLNTGNDPILLCLLLYKICFNFTI